MVVYIKKQNNNVSMQTGFNTFWLLSKKDKAKVLKQLFYPKNNQMNWGGF